MSEAEFVRVYAESKNVEWVDDQVVFKMPIGEAHDIVQAAIRSALEAMIRRRNLGQVRGPSFTMRMGQIPARRDPDVLFVSTASLDRLSKTLLEGPADLVIEIVSPDSVDRDYREKFLEYQASGVREYWIIDVANQVINAYTLDAKGVYQPIVAAVDGTVHSKVVEGFWLRPAILFTDPLPDALTLMIALGIVPAT